LAESLERACGLLKGFGELQMTSNTLLAWQAAADALILSRIFQSMSYRFERFSDGQYM
jgi:hypothetical protein